MNGMPAITPEGMKANNEATDGVQRRNSSMVSDNEAYISQSNYDD